MNEDTGKRVLRVVSAVSGLLGFIVLLLLSGCNIIPESELHLHKTSGYFWDSTGGGHCYGPYAWCTKGITWEFDEPVDETCRENNVGNLPGYSELSALFLAVGTQDISFARAGSSDSIETFTPFDVIYAHEHLCTTYQANDYTQEIAQYQVSNNGTAPVYVFLDYVELNSTDVIINSHHAIYGRHGILPPEPRGLQDRGRLNALGYSLSPAFYAQSNSSWRRQLLGRTLDAGYAYTLVYTPRQFPAVLEAWRRAYCPSAASVADLAALDQCEGLIVIAPGETKPFHYNGYGVKQ